MSISEEINAIVKDEHLSFEDKREKLLKFVTLAEANALLPEPKEIVRLKTPQPSLKGKGKRRTLNLSVVTPIFNTILQGGHVESRAYDEYYKDRCTYVENGKRYLTPFEAIRFFVGRGERAKWAVVEVKDIVCDGDFILFYLGDVVEKYNDRL